MVKFKVGYAVILAVSFSIDYTEFDSNIFKVWILEKYYTLKRWSLR